MYNLDRQKKKKKKKKNNNKQQVHPRRFPICHNNMCIYQVPTKICSFRTDVSNTFL